jgi:hypothetical protein
MFINAMRLRRSRQGFVGFMKPLFFWACLRQAIGTICADIPTPNPPIFHLKFVAKIVTIISIFEKISKSKTKEKPA